MKRLRAKMLLTAPCGESHSQVALLFQHVDGIIADANLFCRQRVLDDDIAQKIDCDHERAHSETVPVDGLVVRLQSSIMYHNTHTGTSRPNSSARWRP